jgi:DNA repair protein RadC
VKVRKVKVQASRVSQGAVEVRLRGGWMGNAGFVAGQEVTITNPLPGVIQITQSAEVGQVLPDVETRIQPLKLSESLGEFRVQRMRQVQEGVLGDTPDSMAAYYTTEIASSPLHNAEVESFCVVCLNTRRRVMGHYIVSNGTLDTLLVHPRETFRGALIAGASAIICLHNHPSGDHTPSEADIKVTRDLVRAGQMLKIELLDHIIIGTANATRPRGYCSLRELGYFYS